MDYKWRVGLYVVGKVFLDGKVYYQAEIAFWTITMEIGCEGRKKSNTVAGCFTSRARLWLKWILFPGIGIATRKRMKLCKYLLHGDINTLDAGCGNGAFSYAAYRLGNRVLGININPEQVQRCNEFRDFLAIDSSRCQFKVHNIYNLAALGQKFDQIICFETLEHLQRDQEVLSLFAAALKTGGVLHLCTPYLNRKPYLGEVISTLEDGGHVRLGYTLEIFEKMLMKEGFEVVVLDKVVGPFSQKVMNFGRWLSIVLLRRLPAPIVESAVGIFTMSLLPLSWLDRLLPWGSYLCIYVQARL